VIYGGLIKYITGSLPSFAPEKGPKATFPYQGKERKLFLFLGNTE
jgi:hypothetical protein